MNWFKKIFQKIFRNSTKELNLKGVKRGQYIYVNTPNGYIKTLNGKQYDDQPIIVQIENNDTIARKIWFFSTVEGTDISFIKTYDDPIFENFVLFNCIELSEKEIAETKEELKKELEDAISQENYEMAKIINNKLKELN